ncbi:MAG TPA: transporter substrate-binding domain-containing protein [Phnomibacter sp.]|nr:transporter substrate-binding domain-containing protein [Phnomibacter sp.]
MNSPGNNTSKRKPIIVQPHYTQTVYAFLFAILLIGFGTSCNNASNNSKKAKVDSLPVQEKPSDSNLQMLRDAQKIYTGDFDTMMKRQIIRVLVPYSRTLFFNDKGKESGITADNIRDFEQFLNKKYRKQLNDIPFTIGFIPTPRNLLIPNLLRGLGDIAAGNLTATEKRLLQVDFIAPKELGPVSEIVVTRKTTKPITHIEQLSGKTIFVRKSSSYFESLQKLNDSLKAKGKDTVELDLVSDNLEDEDLMEMLDAGIISAIVVDEWMAKMWAQILPSIQLHTKAPISTGGYIGYAFRKNSPLLYAELKDFFYNYAQPSGNMTYRFKKYYKNVKRLQDPTNNTNSKRYREIMELFKKYGTQYDFDPLMLAAMGFQESQLDQSQRSPAGAIGVMQVTPGTGASMKVGDITVTEPNIHAGTKYMELLMTEYFKDAHFDMFNRSLFAFASYNAGPTRMVRLRKLAAERGYDPDVWLNSVEIIVSEEVGRETTTYVRNIMKYYYSYKWMIELANKRKKHKAEF